MTGTVRDYATEYQRRDKVRLARNPRRNAYNRERARRSDMERRARRAIARWAREVAP